MDNGQTDEQMEWYLNKIYNLYEHWSDGNVLCKYHTLSTSLSLAELVLASFLILVSRHRFCSKLHLLVGSPPAGSLTGCTPVLRALTASLCMCVSWDLSILPLRNQQTHCVWGVCVCVCEYIPNRLDYACHSEITLVSPWSLPTSILFSVDTAGIGLLERLSLGWSLVLSQYWSLRPGSSSLTPGTLGQAYNWKV